MRGFTIGFAIGVVLASLLVVALLAVTFGAQHGTSSGLPSTSSAVNSISTVNAETKTDATSSEFKCPCPRRTANRTSTQAPQDGPDMKLYLDPNSTPGVPLYPGAKLRSENCDRSCGSGCISYYIASGEEQSRIEAFYKEALLKRGWEYISEAQLISKNYYYSWKNPSDNGPKRIFLLVGFEQESAGTDIAVELDVWPNPKDPPLHLQARNVEVKWAKDPTPGTDRNVRIVSYTVNLSTSEVMGYYKNVMIEQGWCADPELSSDLALNYFYDQAGPIGNGSATVKIMPAEASSGGSTPSTRVEITTGSTEFTPQDAQEGK